MRIKTSRLLIRQFEPEDATGLLPILGDPELMRFSTRGVLDLSQIKTYISQQLENYQTKGFGQWAVLDVKDKQLVGIVGLNSSLLDGQEILHVSYRLHTSAQGKGLAAEAVKAVLNYCKEQLRLDQICAMVDPQNKPSLSLLRRLSFQYQYSSHFKSGRVDIFQHKLKV